MTYGRQRALVVIVAMIASCSDADLERVADARPRDMGIIDAGAIDDAAPTEDAGHEADAHDASFDAPIRADASEPRDASEDAPVAFDARPIERWSLEPTDTVELPVHGGGGGSVNAGACSDGHLLVELQGVVSLSMTPSRVTLVCSRLRSDGSLSPATSDGTFGGSEDGEPYSDTCAPGEVVVGLHGFTVFPLGASGRYVNRIGVSCVPLREWAEGDDSHLRMLPSRGDAFTGDELFDERCPFGYALRELHGLAGAFIDAVGGTCVRIAHDP